MKMPKLSPVETLRAHVAALEHAVVVGFSIGIMRNHMLHPDAAPPGEQADSLRDSLISPIADSRWAPDFKAEALGLLEAVAQQVSANSASYEALYAQRRDGNAAPQV